MREPSGRDAVRNKDHEVALPEALVASKGQRRSSLINGHHRPAQGRAVAGPELSDQGPRLCSFHGYCRRYKGSGEWFAAPRSRKNHSYPSLVCVVVPEPESGRKLEWPRRL